MFLVHLGHVSKEKMKHAESPKNSRLKPAFPDCSHIKIPSHLRQPRKNMGIICSDMGDLSDLAFPNLSVDDFDRYPHPFRGNLGKHWEKQEFPFDIRTLPRLPKIHNTVHLTRARRNRSLSPFRRPDPGGEMENPIRHETKARNLLHFYANEAVIANGTANTSELVEVRGSCYISS